MCECEIRSQSQTPQTYLKASEPDSNRNADKKAKPQSPMVLVFAIIFVLCSTSLSVYCTMILMCAVLIAKASDGDGEVSEG